MARISIQVRAGQLLRHPALDRLRDLQPAMVEMPKLIRARVAAEFASSSWFRPDGGVEPWPRIVPFGNRNSNRPPLVGTGAYLAALQGGAGAIEEVTGNLVRVGVSGAAFPFAAAIRGGSRQVRTTPIYIKPVKRANTKRRGYAAQWAMFWKLGLEFGVWLREATLRRGLELKPRPHLTRHPELERQAGRIIKRYVVTGRAA